MSNCVDIDLDKSLIVQIYDLQQENKELKKQLENCFCNRTDCSGRIKDSKQYDSLVQRVENQQKEFIEYLEERIKVCDNRLSTPFCNFDKTTKERLILIQCLEKLEEIIGGKE